MKHGSPVDPGWTSIVAGAALGAIAMYAFDPDKGRRRRALARDKAVSVLLDTRHAAGATRRDVAHRLEGLRARALRLWTRQPTTDDLQLIERVRARMGRMVSHPHAIQVGAFGARVTLSGPILAHEAAPLLAAVRTVWGVRSVEDLLVVHDHPESVPSLQGGIDPFAAARSLAAGAARGGAVLWRAHGALRVAPAHRRRRRDCMHRRRSCGARRDEPVARAACEDGFAKQCAGAGSRQRRSDDRCCRRDLQQRRAVGRSRYSPHRPALNAPRCANARPRPPLPLRATSQRLASAGQYFVPAWLTWIALSTEATPSVLFAISAAFAASSWDFAVPVSLTTPLSVST